MAAGQKDDERKNNRLRQFRNGEAEIKGFEYVRSTVDVSDTFLTSESHKPKHQQLIDLRPSVHIESIELSAKVESEWQTWNTKCQCRCTDILEAHRVSELRLCENKEQPEKLKEMSVLAHSWLALYPCQHKPGLYSGCRVFDILHQLLAKPQLQRGGEVEGEEERKIVTIHLLDEECMQSRLKKQRVTTVEGLSTGVFLNTTAIGCCGLCDLTKVILILTKYYHADSTKVLESSLWRLKLTYLCFPCLQQSRASKLRSTSTAIREMGSDSTGRCESPNCDSGYSCKILRFITSLDVTYVRLQALVLMLRQTFLASSVKKLVLPDQRLHGEKVGNAHAFKQAHTHQQTRPKLSLAYFHVQSEQQETGTNPLVDTCSTLTRPLTGSSPLWYVSSGKQQTASIMK
ncbi:hypothetical protein EXN66_Car013219 [Channa argus]|uniref:Uncharacterized protein n=1 Tax=Channa argus TaxID=215402 RepID=A0A6G1Q519_CHAAH|nr:hypothetical protein EXN66_Car013219 [Channa argus]